MKDDKTAKGIKRYRVNVSGTVQGVGFRPFVFRLASEYGLSGFVRNNSKGVELEVEGPGEQVDIFIGELIHHKPSASRFTGFSHISIDPCGDDVFTIEESYTDGGTEFVIPPDIATCDDCLTELLNTSDRRHGYAFINCTNCGPRYTIVIHIPYDRDKTTMEPFTMCDRCRKEYEDPLNRRYHAQPNACPDCGPALTLLDASGGIIDTEDSIAETVRKLAEGHIIAIKGLGGFHLAVDATRGDSVSKLRDRKHREEKPFALMSGRTSAVRTFAELSSDEEAQLVNPARPILLLQKKDDGPVAEEVAPGNRYLGVMLPYTPLHHLLFRGKEETPVALVMTSANLREEPIVRHNSEALERLRGIADFFLVHDREIHQRADDSVLRVIRGKPSMIRRSRGYVPSPVILTREVGKILGCGAFLKNTVCLARASYAYLSQHIGDLEHELSHVFYVDTIEYLERILDFRPDVLAHDLHPDYPSTIYAMQRDGVTKVGVQHHHAHIASCLAENGQTGPVIGISCDGTGLGDDGTIWGGEILLADIGEYTRIGHFESFPLPGGNSVVREPWRTACSLIRESFGDDHEAVFSDLFPEIPADTSSLVHRMCETGLNSPLTSSLGRLFDAVSAVLGICRRTTFEGQAAIGLEMVLERPGDEAYPVELREEGDFLILGIQGLIRSVAEDAASGQAPGEISLRFHNFTVNSLAEAAIRAREKTGLHTVALSGGCFQNAYLSNRLTEQLGSSGFTVLTHSLVPPNDGGISLGQVIVADSILRSDRIA